jgi:hypothetical protein
LKLADLIVRTAEAGLRLQHPDGSFPAGCNGPYGDPETPIRNTAHWAITLLAAHRLSGGEQLSAGAVRARDVLMAPGARPMGATFLCRTNPDKDFANGLIGQAWVIEALATLHEALDDRRAHEVATQVFLLHPFSDARGLWRRVNVDGSHLTIDATFNHQLFFAAAGALLDPLGRSEIGRAPSDRPWTGPRGGSTAGSATPVHLHSGTDQTPLAGLRVPPRSEEEPHLLKESATTPSTSTGSRGSTASAPTIRCGVDVAFGAPCAISGALLFSRR